MFSGFGFSRSGGRGAQAEAKRGEAAVSWAGGREGQEYYDDQDDEDALDAQGYDDEHGDAGYDDDDNDWDGAGAGANLPPQDGQLLSSDQEKSRVLIMFKDLRNDGMFCDITFLCQGHEFRAHRVVVSAWSRWLRALLCEEQPSEDVIHLDVFDPLSFGKVLDYMYGVPLSVSIDTAETLLKVVHRLQLQALEESIWIFLMKIVDPNNAEQLHTLADRYDCPPLKLSAWRIMQESIPGYSSLPAGVLAASAAGGVLKGTGLTGPGDPDFLTNQPSSQAFPGVHEDLVDDMPSIFTHFSPPPPPEDEDDGEDDEVDDEGVNDGGSSSSRGGPRRRAAGGGGSNEHKDHPHHHPKELPPSASASELVKAWSARLQNVYQQCNAPEGDNFADPETMEAERGKKIILNVGKKGRQQGLGGAAAGAKTPGSPTKYAHIREVDWRAELRQFYLGVNMPEKLPGIGEILLTWKGKEEQMLSHLMTKYRRSIPPVLNDHLKTLLDYVETQTESSFVR